jgi:hypothetical protein
MKLTSYFPCILAFVLCSLTGISHLRAQQLPTCEALLLQDDGSYVVKIGNDTLLAITEELVDELYDAKVDLELAKKNIALKDSLIATYERVEYRYEVVHRQQKEYIADLEEVLEGYKELAKGYKKLSGDPWVTFSGGLGATGSDEKPAVLAGLGIRRFRVWGLLQESNSVVAVGLMFPLF